MVRIKPKSGRFEISGWNNDRVEILLKSAPEKGKANEELISNLAEILKIKKSDIFIKSGRTSRIKTVVIKFKKREEIIEALFRPKEKKL